MQKNKKNTLHLVNYTIISIGVLLFIFKTFLQTNGEWGIEEHFLTSYLQKLHLLTTPFLVFFVGSIFFEHILVKLSKSSGKLKLSGFFLCFSFVVMVFSGILIQVFYEQGARETAALVHNVATGVWLLSYLAHHFLSPSFFQFKFSRK